MVRSLARSIAWLLLVAVLLVTISPIQWRPISHAPPDLERTAAFAMIGFAFALGYPRHWLLVAFVVVCSAFAFEAAQWISPTRHARFHDAAIKATGGLGGIVVGAGIAYVSRRRGRTR